MTSTIRDILTAHQSGTSIESTITTATQQAEANTHHASTETFTTNAIEIAKKQDKKPSTGLLA